MLLFLNVFCMTRSGIEHEISRLRGERSTTEPTIPGSLGSRETFSSYEPAHTSEALCRFLADQPHSKQSDFPCKSRAKRPCVRASCRPRTAALGAREPPGRLRRFRCRQKALVAGRRCPSRQRYFGARRSIPGKKTHNFRSGGPTSGGSGGHTCAIDAAC